MLSFANKTQPIFLLISLTSMNALASTVAVECNLSSSTKNCASVEHVINKVVEPSSDFEQYKICEEAAFQLFNAEQACEYELFFKQAEEEFASYKKKVGSVWDKPNFSDKKSWVSYSDSLTVKKEIDFEKNVIKITKIQNKDDKQSIEKLKEEIVKTTKLSVSDAQKSDPYIGKIIKSTKAENLSEKPLLPISQNNKQAKAEEKLLLKNIKVSKKTNSKGQEVISLETPFPTTWLNRKEKQFISPVKENAERFKLNPSFILSIIKTESSFNPTAVSHIPAFGLMQVVPTAAGFDATNYLFGKRTKLSRDYLFKPEKNIEIGSAYLYLLKNRYFKGIKNEQSLKYCAIAGYNGGMGPIYRIFGKGSRKKAIANINTLPPQKVYDLIIKKHPATETKNYLKKVTKAENNYLKNL